LSNIDPDDDEGSNDEEGEFEQDDGSEVQSESSEEYV